jgi:hypothetical protein
LRGSGEKVRDGEADIEIIIKTLDFMLKMMAETERLIFFENCYARFMWVELE